MYHTATLQTDWQRDRKQWNKKAEAVAIATMATATQKNILKIYRSINCVITVNFQLTV